MNVIYKIPSVMQMIATAVGIVIIAGCDSGSGTGDSTVTGYVNGPGVPVSTLPATTAIDSDSNGSVEGAVPVIDEPLAAECTLDAKKQWIDASMRDYYLFYDQVPIVNLDDYDSEESLLDDLRVLPIDEFSFVTDIERNIRFIEQGKGLGLGYRWERDDIGLARMVRIFADSPFGRAGVSRGDIIETVNGVAWDDISGNQFSDMLSGPSTWAFTDAINGTRFEVTVEETEYSINTVLHYQTIKNAEYEGTIGYLAFDRFLLTSEDELNTVMDFFREQKITDLVLDLRYNSGGRVKIARQLTSQLAGPATDGQLLVQYRHNDKYTDRNFDIFLESEFKNLGLDRLAVLTTGTTGSASEMVINGLSPYIPVTRFGETTRGKPYVTYNNDLCDKRLNAIEVETFNANDVSVAGGLPANCAAVDDYTRDFGLNSETGQVEGMLVSALDFLVYGTCDSPTTVATQRSAADKESGKREYSPGGSIDIQEAQN